MTVKNEREHSWMHEFADYVTQINPSA